MTLQRVNDILQGTIIFELLAIGCWTLKLWAADRIA